MKHWRKTSGVLISRVVSSCSLLAIAALAYCGPFTDLDARLKQATTVKDKVEILNNADITDGEFSQVTEGVSVDSPKTTEAAVEYVNLRAMIESGPNPGDQAAKLKSIKDPLLFKDTGAKEDANWLANAIKRMQRLFNRKRDEDRPQYDGDGRDYSGIPQFIIYFVWFILGALVLGFIVYLARFIRLGALKIRKAKAVLEEDEPERTLDEWLAQADAFEREGRYREAVRALYLACLLKFDERNIARFVRSQTNWEHLARIENSPRLPAGLDFRTPTQAFDRIWYGHKLNEGTDVANFRAWYTQISRMLQEQAA